MSTPQQDSYLEELEMAEQDLIDAKQAYELADVDFENALEWRRSRKVVFELEEKRLQALKSRE